MKNSIVWLASYPKSGNTWTRIFLANYFANEDRPLSINAADRFGFADAPAGLYRKIGGPNVDLTSRRATLALRARLLNAIDGNGATVNFVKTHNANTNPFGVELIPPPATRSAVYILRNPLDVALSSARHFGTTHEQAVTDLCRSDYVIGSENFVPQFLGSWSDHVSSWAGETRFPVCILRYEDMLKDPATSFETMLRHAGLPIDKGRIEKAVRFSSFDELANQETTDGFKENTKNSERFFTSGKSGNWRTELAPELVKKVRKQHRKMMKKHGYLE
ncbi:MAG: sulfotransferase domain-containing protein [Phycisphaerales bacterium]